LLQVSDVIPDHSLSFNLGSKDGRLLFTVTPERRRVKHFSYQIISDIF
jgi:hypothetical protein